MDGYPRPGKSVLFLGRFDEPRKGMDALIGALPALVERFPDIEILIVGRGDEDELREEAGQLAGHLHFLGQVDDASQGVRDEKRRRLLRAEHRRGELRHRVGGSDGRGHRGGGQ